MSSQANLGSLAVQAKDYPEAIKQYTLALQQSQSPIWLIARALCYQRTKAYELALIDAENAYHAAVQRGKRELTATAQFRRAIALHSLGRMADARMCFIWVRKLNEKEKGLGMWQEKIKLDFERLPEDDPSRVVAVQEIPEKHQTAKQEPKQADKKPLHDIAVPSSSSTPADAPKSQSLPQKVRWEWLQSSSKTTITIFAKGVPKDKVKFELKERSLLVEFPIAQGSDFSLDIDLYAPIDPSQSTHSVTAYKIEISLHKAAQGLKWQALEGASVPEPIASEADVLAEPTRPTPTPLSVSDKPPAYPTSARRPLQNWDTIGDDDEDEGGADDFFKKLYKNADPDTKRAMMKSMEESNGTSLSTDWKDIGSRYVEPSPPEGVEVKKYGA